MKTQFLKGVVLGAVTSVLVLVAATAFAGTGIGGVFNLGQTNSVNARTQLNGATANALLGISNTSASAGARAAIAKSASLTPTLAAVNTGGGVAASFLVNAGTAPFAVNTGVIVANLDADQVDGKSASDFLAADGKAVDAAHADLADTATTADHASTADNATNAANANALGGAPASAYAKVGSCQDGMVHGWAWVTASASFSATYVDVNPNSKNCADGFAQARRLATGTYFVRFPSNGSAIAFGDVFEVDAPPGTNSACSDDYIGIDYVTDPTVGGARAFRVEIHDDGGGLEDCPFDIVLV